MKKPATMVILAALALTLCAQPALARGTPDAAPEVQLHSDSGVFISPNGDGVQDELELSPVVGEGATRAIKSFRLTVFGTSEDLAGRVVWTRTDTQSQNRGFFGDLLNLGEEPQVEIPASLTWDGKFLSSDDGGDGEDAPDGEYIYQLAIVDESGATVTTPPMRVTVDRQPPVVRAVALSYGVFSPNGDGVRDVVVVSQDGSRELRWVGRVVDAGGTSVRTFTWENDQPAVMSLDSGPPAVTWDGTDDSGNVVPDGAYRYILSGADRAGNAAESEPAYVNVSTRAGAVQLLPRRTRFSPNGDGSVDTITADTLISDPEGIVRYLIRLGAADSPDDVLWSSEGPAPVPESITISGNDRRGRSLPDGEYEIMLSVSYENGNTAESEPSTIVIDKDPPRGFITAITGPQETESGAPFVFGGRNKEYVDLTVSLSEPLDWEAVVQLGGSTIRRSLDDLGISGADFSFRWTGTDLDGNRVPDGLATVRFEARDEAGNFGLTNEVRVILDTRDPVVTVSFAGDYLSPNGDGVNETVVVETGYSVDELIDQFLLSIEDDRGRIIRTEYKRTPFSSFEWLGRSNGNTPVADGVYYANLQVIYYNGNAPTARSGPITVDRTAPAVLSLSAPYRLFSPDGDGERDTVTVAQSTSFEDEWVGVITDGDGNVILTRKWAGTASNFNWDGRSGSGAIVPDGDYIYRLSASDSAGNTGTEHLTIVVDTRSAPVSQQPPDVSLTVGPLPFTPDGDGTNDRLTITAAAASENTLSGWDLVVTDPFGAEVTRWSGSGAPRRFISWDGKAPDGELVQSAQEYVATLTVTDALGNTGSESAIIAVGILVIRDGLTLRIMVPSIHFAPYTSDLFSVSSADLRKNLDTLRSLAAVLNRYPDHQILIEGHAAHDYYQEGPRKDREQREELLPLSAARAEEVRQALIILNVESQRMRTIGIGGARPVVPHSDRENLWKNRRVEFILERR